MSTVKTIGAQPLIHLVAQCLDCRVRHEIQPVNPGTPFLREMDEWSQKHLGHQIEFFSPRRNIPRDLDDKVWMQMREAPWWLQNVRFKENANIKLAYNSTATMTFTSLNSLATSSTLLAGASALAIDNSGGLYLDYLVSGLIKNSGSVTPTGGTSILVYAYRAYNPTTPTYPDVLDGTDATKTMTTLNILTSGAQNVANMTVTATQNQVNPFDVGAISSIWNGVTPALWSLFVTHNSATGLNSSGHAVYVQGVYNTAT